jgi:hypothetical protein
VWERPVNPALIAFGVASVFTSDRLPDLFGESGIQQTGTELDTYEVSLGNRHDRVLAEDECDQVNVERAEVRDLINPVQE